MVLVHVMDGNYLVLAADHALPLMMGEADRRVFFQPIALLTPLFPGTPVVRTGPRAEVSFTRGMLLFALLNIKRQRTAFTFYAVEL